MALLGAFSLKVQAQYDQTDSTYRRRFVGTSLFAQEIWIEKIRPTSFNWTLVIALQERTSFVYRQNVEICLPNGIHPF